jgi:plasmid maintenance system antidote protein VapI
METLIVTTKVVRFQGELARLLLEKDITSGELAQRLMITYSHMQNIIRGTIAIDKKQGIDICLALGVGFEEFFRGAFDREPGSH